jgi:putative NADH-flavin reductase
LSLCVVACNPAQVKKDGEILIRNDVIELSSSPRSLNIMVFGGTSGIGLETVKLAAQRGHRVTSITRRPERMEFTHPRMKNLKGDITKPETYSELINDHDVFISTIGLSPTWKDVYVYSNGIIALLSEMKASDKTRLITITGIGAGDSLGHGGFFYDWIIQPLLLKKDYEDKNRQEEILQRSDLSWTIVRPGHLTDSKRKENYRVIRNIKGVVSGSISRADVAHYLMHLSEEPTNIKEVILLTD